MYCPYLVLLIAHAIKKYLISGQALLENFPAKIFACAKPLPFDFQHGCRSGGKEPLIETGPHREFNSHSLTRSTS